MMLAEVAALLFSSIFECLPLFYIEFDAATLIAFSLLIFAIELPCYDDADTPRLPPLAFRHAMMPLIRRHAAAISIALL